MESKAPADSEMPRSMLKKWRETMRSEENLMRNGVSNGKKWRNDTCNGSCECQGSLATLAVLKVIQHTKTANDPHKKERNEGALNGRVYKP